MTDLSTIPQTIGSLAAWTGAQMRGSTQWLYLLAPEEIAEIEEAGARFLAEDPDLR